MQVSDVSHHPPSAATDTMVTYYFPPFTEDTSRIVPSPECDPAELTDYEPGVSTQTKCDWSRVIRNEISTSSLLWGVYIYAVSIEIDCVPTQDAFDQWKLDTIEKIMQGYRQQKSEYEDTLARAAIGEGISVRGRNPQENQKLIKVELQRSCISLLMENHLERFDPFLEPENTADSNSIKPNWRMNFAKTKEHAIDVRFFQNAFEWQNMTYIFYPYFWGRSASWANRLLEFGDPDPNLSTFLKAGAVRVQVPVREQFGDTMLKFAQSGKIDLGEESMIIDGELYVSALDEYKESLGSLDDAKLEGVPFEVTVPTSLVLLQSADQITFRDPLKVEGGDRASVAFNASIQSDNS